MSEFSPVPSYFSPQEKSLIDYHRRNLTEGTFLRDDQGTTSVYITGIQGPDGREYLVPGYFDGRRQSPDASAKRAAALGWQNYPSYPSVADAEQATKKIKEIINQDPGDWQQWPMAKLYQQQLHTHGSQRPMEPKAKAFHGYVYGGEGPKDAAELGLSVLPGSGDAMALRDYYKHSTQVRPKFEKGDYAGAAASGINAGTAALGAIPVFGAIPRAARGVAKYTTKALDRLKTNLQLTRGTVSPQLIEDLMRSSNYTDVEKDVILRTLDKNREEHGKISGDPYKVNLGEFIDEVEGNI